MSAFTTEERIALLLSLLGKEVSDAATRSLNPTRAKYVQRLIKDYETNPPSEAEADYIIDDFVKYFHFALSRLEPEIRDSKAKADQKEAEAGEEGKASSIVYFPKIVPTNDPVADLNKLAPYQITVALEHDHAKTVALVMSKLDSALAAEVLAGLSEEVRNAAIIFLTKESTVPALIQNKVLCSTVEKAITVEFKTNTVDQTQILADLMRSIPKHMRGELLVQLEEEDEEFCAKVKKLLYVFEDIARLGDRDIQKMLGEIQTDFLIVGLQKADQSLTDKLLGNLSKRARQTVLEEMQYKTNSTQEEIDAARNELVTVLARLDEAGEVTLN